MKMSLSVWRSLIILSTIILCIATLYIWKYLSHPEETVMPTEINNIEKRTGNIKANTEVKQPIADDAKIAFGNQNRDKSSLKDEENYKGITEINNIYSKNTSSDESFCKDSQIQEQNPLTECIDPEKYYSQFDKIFDQGPVPLNMIGIPILDANGLYGIENSKGQRLPDGTMLVYYRRKDGSLIRKVEKPDGTTLRWVIDWMDLTPYYEIAVKSWSDE